MARLKNTRTPEILTVNGKAELVVRDAKRCRQLTERRACPAPNVAGLPGAERVELNPASQVLSGMRPGMAYRVSLTLPAENGAYAAFERIPDAAPPQAGIPMPRPSRQRSKDRHVERTR